jgi:hypothetical protein
LLLCCHIIVGHSHGSIYSCLTRSPLRTFYHFLCYNQPCFGPVQSHHAPQSRPSAVHPHRQRPPSRMRFRLPYLSVLSMSCNDEHPEPDLSFSGGRKHVAKDSSLAD